MGRSQADRPPKRPHPLTAASCDTVVSSGLTRGFPRLSLCPGYVTHVFLALSPLYRPGCPGFRVRLACFSHAASVRSEPGSNSSLECWLPRVADGRPLTGLGGTAPV